MKVSNCCGDPGNKLFGNEDDGVTYKDVELCGNCLEHCEYVEEDGFDINVPLPKKSFKVKAKIKSIKNGLG